MQPSTDTATADAKRSGARPGLSGVKVLEISDSPGACFAAGLLADFGADVTACESLPGGSQVRSIGTDAVRKVWWQTIARNKRSIAVNAGRPETERVMRALFAGADLVVTDLAPDARRSHPLLRWQHEYSDLSVVGIFPTGADLPGHWDWSDRAEMAGAAAGTQALTGWPGKAPLQPEVPLVEYLAGTLAALRAVTNVRNRKVNGGAAADMCIPLHQALHRMIEWQVPLATLYGTPTLRDGNAFPLNAGIGNMHRARDGRYVAISAASGAVASRLLEMIGGPQLRDDPRFSTPAARAHGLEELYVLIDKWVGERSVEEILVAALRHDVVIGPVLSADEIPLHPQILARGNVAALEANDGRAIPMPAVVPRINGISARVRHAGPALGENSEAVLEDAGFTAEEVQALIASGAIVRGGP